MELMNKIAMEESKKLDCSFEKAYKKIQLQADTVCEEMFSTLHFPSLRPFIVFLNRLFDRIYEKIVVD